MSGHEMRQLLDVVLGGGETHKPKRTNLNENAIGGTTQKVYDGLMRLAKNPNFDPDEHQENVTYLLARHKGPLSGQELAQKFEAEYGMDPWHYAKQLKQEMSDDFMEEAPLREKAKSQNQQQAAGMALAAKRGEMPVSELQGAAKEMYDMSEADLEDYAETEHEGLPTKVDEEQLDEDMGELQQIDPALRQPFQSYIPMRKPGITHGKLGRGSPVWEVKPKNAMDAWRMLDDMMAEEKPMGIVLRVSGEQVYSLFKRTTKSYNAPAYRFAFNTDWWRDQGQGTDIGTKLANYRMDTQGEGGENKVTGHIRGIIKAAKTLGQPVDALVVGEDLERAQKQRQRRDQQYGKVDDPSSDQFKREARQQLSRRLDRFKASKAKQYDSPEEFLEDIKHSGILDKVNIGGFSYSMGNENLRLNNLLGRDRMGQEAYIDYQLDDFMKAMDHQKETGERIPDKITVTFKLDGMQLVPTGVKTNR